MIDEVLSGCILNNVMACMGQVNSITPHSLLFKQYTGIMTLEKNAVF